MPVTTDARLIMTVKKPITNLKSKIEAASQDMGGEESRRRMTIDLPILLHTKLKVVAALKGKTMAEIICGAVEKELKDE